MFNAKKHVGKFDNLTLGKATDGMSPEVKSIFIEALRNEVIEDMKADGVPVVEKQLGLIKFGHTPSGVETDRATGDVLVDEKATHDLTLRQLKSVLAHDLRHTQQPREFKQNHTEYAEKDADRIAAMVYGVKTFDGALKNISRMPKEEYLSMKVILPKTKRNMEPDYRPQGEAHGSIHQREYDVKQPLLKGEIGDPSLAIPKIPHPAYPPSQSLVIYPWGYNYKAHRLPHGKLKAPQKIQTSHMTNSSVDASSPPFLSFRLTELNGFGQKPEAGHTGLQATTSQNSTQAINKPPVQPGFHFSA